MLAGRKLPSWILNKHRAIIRPSLLSALFCFLFSAWSCDREPPLLPGETLVVAFPTSFHDQLPNSDHEEFALTIKRNIYDSLVEHDSNLALKPSLAESWSSPDDRTWIFKLRKGVRFHDGRILEAKHVVRSIEATRKQPNTNVSIPSLESVTAPDPETILIRTFRPYSLLAADLEGLLIWDGETPHQGLPSGTGPYRVRRWHPDSDIFLEGFRGHWRGAPSIPDLRFRVIADPDQRLEKLKKGRVHLLVDVPAADWESITGQNGIQKTSSPGLRVIFLGMNASPPDIPFGTPRGDPLDDVRVRRAVAHAINRKTLVAGPLGGHAEIVDQLIPPQVLGYHDKMVHIEHNPALSRKLLNEAGYGQGLAIDLDYISGKYRAIDQVAQLVMQDLNSVGIRTRIRPHQYSEFMERMEKTASDFFMIGWMTTGEAGLSYLFLLHTPGNGWGNSNFGNYSNSDIDKLLEEALSTRDTATRVLLYRVLSELVQSEMPIVPLYRQQDLYAYSDGLEFHPRFDRRILGYEIAWKPIAAK